MAMNESARERRLGYLARAENARMIAVKTNDIESREAWGKIADSWQDLAEQILLTDKM
jgi:hypothetical protein